MHVPRELRDAASQGDDVVITRRDEEDGELLAIDFGRGADASLDLLGDTAIVVAGDRQFEFEVPRDADELTVNDGILTIRS